MAAPTIRQYHGASARHPRACVELTFANDGVDDGGRVDLAPVAEALARAGAPLPAALPEGPLGLAEAIGTLACAALSRPLPPPWSHGTEGGEAWVCLSHPYPAAARAALSQAHAAVVAAASGAPVPEGLRRLAARAPAISPTNVLVMSAAAFLGFETPILSHHANIFQIGQGARGRHYFELANERDAVTGHLLANDKRATVETLSRLGLPTTRAVSAGDAEAVARAARQVGFPCVVKPVRRGKGHGITTRIRDEAQLGPAIEHALRYGGYPLLVENHVEGHDHRMMVVDGALLWVYRRTPPYVTGDGRASLRELIARENARRRTASAAHRFYLKDIEIVPALERFVADQYGIAPDSVPAEGARIDLAGQANLAQGGTLKDVTGAVHPDNRELAQRIARLFRAGALGIDFITPDIARSWREVPSAVIEVNGTPGISGMGDACLALRTALPRRLSGRIPSMVAVGDEAYRAAIGAPLLEGLRGAGLAVGHAVYLKGTGAPVAGAEAAWSVRSPEVERLLLDPRVEAMVVLAAPEALARGGFPLERCDVLFAADGAVPPYADGVAARTVTGVPAPDAVARLAAETAAPYRNGAEGGPRPTLEWLAEDGDRLRLRCWRIRALPRAWFARQVPGTTETAGMLGYRDVFEAVVRLADARLGDAGEPACGARFAFAEPDGPWETPYVEAAIAVPSARREALGEALRHGAEAVDRLLTRRA
jgi:D-alanine-D-alanine ligase-like ATP-grasp enzyme